MTLQQHFNLITEGKGNKAQFLKQARLLFPEYFNQYTDFDTATNVLKSKQIISEAAGGVVAKGFSVYDWKKILGEEVKATEKETSKEVKDKQEHAFQPSDMKNADNINFNEIMKGFFAEMYDEKNKEKTGDEIKAMVVKNLAKDPLYYTKNGNFSTMGVGYTEEAPGLGEPKAPKGKHKSSGYGELKEGKIPAENRNTYYYVKLAKDMKEDGKSKEEIRQFFKDEEVDSELVDTILSNIFLKLKEDISQERYEEELEKTVAKYVKDPDDIDKEMSNYYSKGYQGFSDALKANLSRDRDLDTLVQMMHDEETLRREQGLEEQKLRSLIRNIIKEELNEGSIDINGKTVRTYTQNGDKSYNVTYDDGTKDRIAVSNDAWDEINTLYKNTNPDLNENESSVKKGDILYHKNSDSTLEVVEVSPTNIKMKVTKISDKTPSYIKVGQSSKTNPAAIGKTYTKK